MVNSTEEPHARDRLAECSAQLKRSVANEREFCGRSPLQAPPGFKQHRHTLQHGKQAYVHGTKHSINFCDGLETFAISSIGCLQQLLWGDPFAEKRLASEFRWHFKVIRFVVLSQLCTE